MAVRHFVLFCFLTLTPEAFGLQAARKPLIDQFPPWFWLAVAVGLLLALCGVIMRLLPRKGTRISFEELSSDKDSRLNKSRVLTGLMMELLTPKQLSEDEFRMDIMPGTDEPGFSGVMPALEREDSTGYEAADRPVKIASVEFVPREVISLFGWLRWPTEESIEGWLDSAADEAIVSANYVRRRRFRPSFRKQWLVRLPGPQARDEVLSLLAAQIIVDLRKVDFTRSGRSYRALRSALRTSLLDHDASSHVLSTRQYLETALSHDPANWIARFSLALELCKCGYPREAVKQFELLETLLQQVTTAHVNPADNGQFCATDSEAFLALYDHLRKYPACPDLVQYNKAIALAACDDLSSREAAVKLLDELASPIRTRALTTASSLNHRAAAELRLNALSAKGNMIAADAWRRGEFTLEESQEVQHMVSEVERICLTEQDEHWRSFQTARAVAQAAYARVLIARRDGPAALTALHTALAAQPTFAGAHMQMAETYIAFQTELRRDWATRAKDELQLAGGLTTGCRQVQSLLAALTASEAIGKTSEAEQIYQTLGELPAVALWFGQLIVNTRAKECPALFAVHQQLAVSSGVSPAVRERLTSLVTTARDSAGPRARIAAARSLLVEIEAAMLLPPGLLQTAKQQLELKDEFQTANA